MAKRRRSKKQVAAGKRLARAARACAREVKPYKETRSRSKLTACMRRKLKRRRK